MNYITASKIVSRFLFATTALVFLTANSHAQNQYHNPPAGHCGYENLTVVYCGEEGMTLRCGPGTNNNSFGNLYHGATVTPTGESQWVCGTLWKKVLVKGYMPISGGCDVWLIKQCHNQWKVYSCSVPMYNPHGCLTARIRSGSVYGNHICNGKLYASVYGWVATQTSSGKVFIR